MTKQGEVEATETHVRRTVELVLDHKNGDEGALNEVFRRYYPKVLTLVRIRMGSRLRAHMNPSDVAQETFANATRDLKKARVDGQGALIHWLAVVAEHVIRGKIDYVTALKRDAGLELELEGLRRDVGSGEFSMQLESGGPSPERQLEKREQLATLVECMAQLTELQREALLLRRFAGCSERVTAEKLGRSPDSIRGLLSRAEAELLALMEAHGHEAQDLAGS